jgi:hypothetical protein
LKNSKLKTLYPLKNSMDRQILNQWNSPISSIDWDAHTLI